MKRTIYVAIYLFPGYVKVDTIAIPHIFFSITQLNRTDAIFH